MEQMRLSRCYVASESLTCTTCHDPHQKPEPAQQTAWYRNTCIKCHESESCGLTQSERVKIQADDSCVACHMPESATEIPHFAFTHHRIGIHQPDEPHAPPSDVQRLVPLADVSHLSPLDQDRGLGLAYLQISDLPEHMLHGESYRDRARRILWDVHQRGMRDPAVDAALARLFWQRDEIRTVVFAESVLAAPNASPDDRATALFTLGTTYFQQGRIQEAVPLLQDLVHVRRYADAWHALSLCHEQLGNLPAALTSCLQAAEIAPIRPAFQERLAYLYELSGQPEPAAEHRKRARQLLEWSHSP